MENKDKIGIPAAIVIAGIIIAGAIIVTKIPATPKTPAVNDSNTAPVQTVKNMKISGEPFIGNPNAKVIVAYWYDFQCPFCKQAEGKFLQPIINDYVNSGKVKIVYKGLQFLGPDSEAGGIASWAVWETSPEKFGEWIQAMFEKQDAENSGWGNATDINTLTATVLGADSASKVEKLITEKSDVYKKMITAEQTEGESFGINSTPTFVVNDKIIQPRSYAEIKAMIDSELK